MATMWEEEKKKKKLPNPFIQNHWSNLTKTQLKHVSSRSTVYVGPTSYLKRRLSNGD